MPAGYGRGLPALESAGIELIAPTQSQLLTPTQQGLDAGVVLVDTGKQHGSGAPVRQLKWPSAILAKLKI